jgi:uncharacterized protein
VWRPGEAVLLQNVLLGVVVGALPMTVVDDGLAVAAWIAPETPGVWPDGRDGEGRLRPSTGWGHVHRLWEGNGVVALTPWGRRYCIWHFWDDDGSFRGWYVHLQAPATRGPDRFQITDWQLDLVIRPGGDVEWKDEDDLARAVEVGIHTAEEAEAAYAEANRVLDDWPFPTGWEDWRPDPGWPIPQLPDDWTRA